MEYMEYMKGGGRTTEKRRRRERGKMETGTSEIGFTVFLIHIHIYWVESFFANACQFDWLAIEHTIEHTILSFFHIPFIHSIPIKRRDVLINVSGCPLNTSCNCTSKAV